MRLSTNIESSGEYFTDLNGYQVSFGIICKYICKKNMYLKTIKRKRFQKLPIQANYYPMPTSIYIEDKTSRLSVLTSSPLGCSSLQDGQVEIMLDRRLNQDDNRGLGQGVLDNHPTKHIFRVLLEKKTHKCQVHK